VAHHACATIFAYDAEQEIGKDFQGSGVQCMLRYFEDAAIGEVFESPRSIRVTREAILEFAREWDPQIYHIDEEAAESSFAKGLSASGIHSLALAQKLVHESGFFKISPVAGINIGDIELSRAVVADDEVRVRVTILAMRGSKSRPTEGIITNLTELINQNDEVVLRFSLTELVHRRLDGA
jgi:acyl dehydratase